MSDKPIREEPPTEPPHEVVAELTLVAKAYGYEIEDIVLAYSLQGVAYAAKGKWSRLSAPHSSRVLFIITEAKPDE